MTNYQKKQQKIEIESHRYASEGPGVGGFSVFNSSGPFSRFGMRSEGGMRLSFTGDGEAREAFVQEVLEKLEVKTGPRRSDASVLSCDSEHPLSGRFELGGRTFGFMYYEKNQPFQGIRKRYGNLELQYVISAEESGRQRMTPSEQGALVESAIVSLFGVMIPLLVEDKHMELTPASVRRKTQHGYPYAVAALMESGVVNAADTKEAGRWKMMANPVQQDTLNRLIRKQRETGL